MTEQTPKLPALLISAGYSPRVAKAFAWLVLNGTTIVTSRELERGADLRQPEAHYAIRKLMESGWIKEIQTPPDKKAGRPFIRYQFTLTKEQALEEIRKHLSEKASEISKITDEIKAEIFAEPQKELPAESP